jgi:predicted PurR-regulated permease PerM
VIQLPPRRTLTPWLVGAGLAALAVVFHQAIALGLAAFAIAYVFAPSVKRLQGLGAPRPLAILTVLLVGTALVVSATAALVPELMRQVQSLVQSVPDYSAAALRRWIPWLRSHFHLHIPARTEDALAQLGLRASSIAPRIGSLLNDTLGYTLVLVEYLFKALVVLALTFYLLLDFDPLLRRVFELVPHRARPRVRLISAEIDETLRHFIHGQLLVMSILGALYALGLGMLGVPAGWAIGVFSGLISFVPYLGFFVALGMAVLMAALQGREAGQLFAVASVMAAVHVLDLTVITPRILGGRAKISPVVVILALVGGGSVFGVAGVLLAIPVASVSRVLLRELVAHYKTTGFFLKDGPPGPLQSVPIMAPTGPISSDVTEALFASTPPPPAAARSTPPKPATASIPPEGR